MSQIPVHVTRSFLPPVDEYKAYIDRIWENGQLTNRGPLLQEFEQEMREYLNVTNFQFVTNGTLALQLAIDGLGITAGEIITTPFSYVATTSAILWQRCTPVFVDIEPQTLNIDPSKIEAAITKDTKAILAVHVFGNACDVDKIEQIAKKHDLKVIYDAAHAFGATYKGKSLLDYGDVSIVSFHATKLFHTIEGGGIITKSKEVHERIDLKKRFGHNGDEHILLGINAKANEFQAAMGLVNLRYVDDNIKKRQTVFDAYVALLEGTGVKWQALQQSKGGYNYAYCPIILPSGRHVESILQSLGAINVFPRRYFYPSLNTVDYVESAQPMPVSEEIAKRVLCLPLFPDIDPVITQKIAQVIRGAL